MWDIVWDFRYLIVFIILALALGLAQWSKTKALVYNLMLRAKDLAKEQEDWVVHKLMQILPAPITLFIGEDMLRSLVKFLYNKGIDYLDDGKFNNSIKK